MTWRRTPLVLTASLVAAFVAGLPAACARRSRPTPPPPTAWVSTADRARLLDAQPVHTDPGAPADVVIALDTTATFQPIEGFGAALTDASRLVLDRLPPAERTALLRDLFSPTDGIGLSVLRVPLGASDFSPIHDSYDDVPPGVHDTTFRWFRFDRERERVAMLHAIRRVQPALQLIGAPWSAPAWMKTPATLIGGTLRDEAMPWYAEYLARVVGAFDSAGVRLDYVSVQNEPRHAPTDYPGMRLSAAQRATLLGAHVGPMLAERYPYVRLLEWDHNWDAPEEPLAVLQDSAARRAVHGVAWHCCAGDVSAQSVVHAAHPTVATWFTECAGGAWAPDFGDNLLWNVRTLVIGATQHWARGVLLWNLALDERHGPHRGGCADCRGVVTVDAAIGRVTRNAEYYALAHASRFVRRGAVRIGSAVTRGDTDTFAQVAFRHADGDGSLVVIAANAAPVAQWVRIEGGVRAMRLEMPARSVVTVEQR